jgi:signal transduction histidine kinase
VAPEHDRHGREVLGALARGEPVSATMTLQRRDGTTFPAAIAAAPLVDVDDATSSVVALVRDLTDELRVRGQIVRGERLAATGELVSSIAYQLNNPMQTVIGTADILLAGSHTPEVRTDLERLRHEAWRAGHIIRNLLTFVRRSPGDRLLGELNEIVQTTLALCSFQLHTSKIKTVQSYASDLPLVLMNRDEIQQVIMNLITNAEQSLTDAGRSGTITVRTCCRGSDAVIEIADDGPGVPPEVAGRLFEPFVTTKELPGPTGFGLSTAFGIVTAHGGVLELVPGSAGACFRLTLPGAGFAGPVVRAV